MNSHQDTKPSIKKKKHFLSNKEFYAEIIEYQASVKLSIENGKETPQVGNRLGECFLTLCRNLVYKQEFINYPYRDDLVSFGVINCLLYMHNFNPEKSNNPFAYFTQIVKNAYIRYIMKEYHQKNIIGKVLSTVDLESIPIDDEDDNVGLVDYLNDINRMKHDYYSDNSNKIDKPKQATIIRKKRIRENALC